MTDKSAPIPLSRIIQRFASFSYNEIEKLLDEDSGEEVSITSFEYEFVKGK